MPIQGTVRLNSNRAKIVAQRSGVNTRFFIIGVTARVEFVATEPCPQRVARLPAVPTPFPRSTGKPRLHRALSVPDLAIPCRGRASCFLHSGDMVRVSHSAALKVRNKAVHPVHGGCLENQCRFFIQTWHKECVTVTSSAMLRHRGNAQPNANLPFFLANAVVLCKQCFAGKSHSR